MTASTTRAKSKIALDQRAPSRHDRAEFDIMVRTDMQGRGFGFRLMKEILAQARERGLKAIVGYVANRNRKMLSMATELGFSFKRLPAGVVRITARL
jgi:acetyltransferase